MLRLRVIREGFPEEEAPGKEELTQDNRQESECRGLNCARRGKLRGTRPGKPAAPAHEGRLCPAWGWWGKEGVMLGGLRVTEGRAQVKDEDLNSRSDTAKVSRLGKTPL